MVTLDTDVDLFKRGIVTLQKFARVKRDNCILKYLFIKKAKLSNVYNHFRTLDMGFPMIACSISYTSDNYKFAIANVPKEPKFIATTMGSWHKG
ncbi:MAG: hypothetical protein HUJ51_01870 [Eggerthellaceae bacterium]|nr:hypothetical protein [Eggerthellaceae bacterium]